MIISTFTKFTTYLSNNHCPIINVFMDWNPIYEDGFKAGDSNALGDNNKIVKSEGEDVVNPWAKFIESCKKL